MSFLSRLFGRKETQSSPELCEVVTFDGERIVCTMRDGKQETVVWADLQNVTILTTDDGPFSEDVFWVLSGSETGCLVPSEAKGIKELLPRLQQLPGFNHEAVIRAMGSTTNEKFLCWQRKDK